MTKTAAQARPWAWRTAAPMTRPPAIPGAASPATGLSQAANRTTIRKGISTANALRTF
jgi:hypothetical protein